MESGGWSIEWLKSFVLSYYSWLSAWERFLALLRGREACSYPEVKAHLTYKAHTRLSQLFELPPCSSPFLSDMDLQRPQEQHPTFL